MRRTLTSIPWVSMLCAGALLMGAVACSDDDDTSTADETSSTTTSAPEGGGPTTLAQGEDIELVGEEALGAQTLNIDAVEENGEVTGEFRVSEVVTRVDCADTDTDGIVILGGEVTTGAPGFIEVGELMLMIIREGDPDSVAIGNNADNATSCTEFLESIPDEGLTDDSNFDLLEDGSDIETG